MSRDDHQPPRAPIHAEMEITARYPGECNICKAPITVGQRIVGEYYQSRSGKTRGMHGPYSHVTCRPVATETECAQPATLEGAA